jgi:hypothetical protein
MKLTGPMMSLDASGSIGGVLVAAKWKGRNYMRTLVTPSNPRSAGQTSTRAMMKFLSQNWAAISDGDKASWEELAAAGSYSPFNAYTSFNMARWTQWQSPTQVYPVPAADTPGTVSAFTGTAGVRQNTLNVTLSSVDDNWGIILYRSATDTFTPSKTDVVLVGFHQTAGALAFIDTPVAAGVWHYRVGTFSVGGVKATIFATEVDLTTT